MAGMELTLQTNENDQGPLQRARTTPRRSLVSRTTLRRPPRINTCGLGRLSQGLWFCNGMCVDLLWFRIGFPLLRFSLPTGMLVGLLGAVLLEWVGAVDTDTKDRHAHPQEAHFGSHRAVAQDQFQDSAYEQHEPSRELLDNVR